MEVVYHGSNSQLPDNQQDIAHQPVPLRCSQDLSVRIDLLKTDIKNSTGITRVFNKLGLTAKSQELKELQRQLIDGESGSKPGKLKQILTSLTARISTATSKLGKSAGKIEKLREKNLQISQSAAENKPAARIILQGTQFSTEGKDVHANRVFLAEKTVTSKGEAKETPSQWYRKGNISEFIFAPMYSLLVPGSPEGALVTGKNEYDIQYASKQIEGARSPTANDLKRGKMTGLGKCAVAVAVFGYRDVRPGNALLDKNNRMVMLDYESRIDESVSYIQKGIKTLLSNPLERAKGFFDSSKGPTQEQVVKHQNSPKFKEEMTHAFIHFLAFPSAMLNDPLDKRMQTAKAFDNWSGASETGKLATAVGFLREELLSGTPEANQWKAAISQVLSGDLETVAKGIVSEMADSRILRELNYDELVQNIKTNLESLRQAFAT